MLNFKTSNNSLLRSSLDTLKFLKPKKINSLKYSPSIKDSPEKSCELNSKNQKDCSDIKTIVKNSVEKINYLFNLKEMQEAKIKNTFSPKKLITVNHTNNILTNKFSNKAFDKNISDMTRNIKRGNNYFKDKNQLEYCDSNSNNNINNNINSNELNTNKNKNSFKEYSIIVNKKIKPNTFAGVDLSLIYKNTNSNMSNNEHSINELMNSNNYKKEKKYAFTKKNKNTDKNKQDESKINKKMHNFKSYTKMPSKINLQNNYYPESKLFYRTGDNFFNMMKNELLHDETNSYSSNNIINTSKKILSSYSYRIDRNIKKNYIQRNLKRPINYNKYHKSANKYLCSNIHKIIRQAMNNTKTKNINNLYPYKTDGHFSKLNSNRNNNNSRSFKSSNKINNTKEINNQQIPNKIYTNTILKIFLLLNEYLLNNNVLMDINNKNKRKILNNFTKYLISNMKIDYPYENEIKDDKYINSVRKIQRIWREKRIDKFLGNNLKENEIKKMVVNRNINKIGFKMKKLIALFNSLVQDFKEIEENEDLNEMFYLIKKIVNREENSLEKNNLFRGYLNNLMYLKD